MTHEEISLDRHGPRIAGRRWRFGRSGAHTPVLALHGWLDNAATFDRLIPALGTPRDFVALDLPGHGRSAHRSADASYYFVDWALDVDRALRELGWDKCILLGHSLGAGVAAVYAGTFPDKVERLAAVDGLVPLTGEASSAPSRLAEAAAARLALKDKRLPIYKTIEDALRARMLAGKFAGPDGIRAVVERGLMACEGGFTWTSDPRLKTPSAMRLTRAAGVAFMAGIKCPVKVVVARQGLPREGVFIDDWREMTPAVADLTIVEIDGHHHVHLDDPAGVAALLKGFLAP